MKNPLISVVVPIYKVEEYLQRCVDSIINQTYKNLEIILIDDGSPDSCPEMCDNFAKQDKRIKVIHKKNGGLMAAWIDGLKIATGEYIYFIDSDDWVEEHSVQDYVDAINSCHPDVIINDFFIVSSKQKRVTKALSFYKTGFVEKEDFKHFKALYLNHNLNLFYARWNKVFKTKILLDNIKFCDTSISVFEDVLINIATLLDIKNVYLMNKPGYNYFIRENSMIRTNFKQSLIQNHDNCLKAMINIQKSKKIKIDELICKLTYSMTLWLTDRINWAKKNKKENYKLLNNSFLLNNEYIQKMPKYLGKIKTKVFYSLKNQKYTTFNFLRFLAKIKHKLLKR